MPKLRGRPRRKKDDTPTRTTPKASGRKKDDSDSVSTTDDENLLSSSSVENETLLNESPEPEYDIGDNQHFGDVDDNVRPTTGINCKRHRAFIDNMESSHNYANLRTLYSHFPRENFRLCALHVIFTTTIYIVIFPFVNFFWTYFLNVDDQIVKLFSYISDEPSYTPGSFTGHLNRLRWFTFPSFNAECISLLLAMVIKDAITINWENLLESNSLTNIIAGKAANRYSR